MANTRTDWRGRSYLIGPVPPDRTRMFWLAWAAMLAIGPLQYGYAALLTDGAAEADGSGGLLPLAVWAACQAAGALLLVRQRRPNVRLALGTGALLSSLGLAALAFGAPTLVGYAVLGGFGAGLVYGVCSQVVSSWHPERAGVRVGLVTGAFCYGAVPLLIWVGIDPGAPAFLVAALFALVVIGAAARSLRLAPPAWWPDTVDPCSRALDPVRLRRTPSAVREFTLVQALRTRALATLAAILVCAGAVSLLDVIVVAATGAWSAVALLVALNGAGRAVAMRLSEAMGRRRVLAAVLALLATGQILLAGATAATAQATSGVLLWAGVVAAGLGGGAFYPLVASLVRDFFGVDSVGRINAVVYSAKAVAGALAVALALAAPGQALLAAAALAILPAVASLRLRAPGLPVTIPV